MSNEVTTQKPQMQIMKVLQETKPAQIAELEFVKEKFIQNYNMCNPGNLGEMMYHRQLVHFKQQITGSDQLKAADPFSLYACFVTAAVNGYSLDPQDNEVYLIPLKGKAYLWRQAGAHVKRLTRTNQIKYVDQPQLVYEGDDFGVKNGVPDHTERFKSETIIAAYVRFVLPDGKDRYFIYRKSDWEAWKKKSQQASGDNWTGNNGQPGAAFLRTKVVLHACKEKCWATGLNNVQADNFNSIEIDDETDPNRLLPEGNGNYEAKMIVTPAGQLNEEADDDFDSKRQPEAETVTHDDDDF